MPRRRKRRRKTSKPRILLLVFLALGLTLWYLAWRQPTPPADLVARVLFSETANCSSRERLLVAGVMANRIANPAFGNSPSIQAVVLQRGAFSCINDPANANWQRTGHLSRLTSRERAIYQQCLALSHASIPPALGPSGRPLVYYHDKSIGKPASWDNKRYRAVHELTTEHFLFYSVLPAGT